MRLLVIDGNSIINRAFYGIRLLSTKDGVYTNGIYGFLNILFKLLDEVHPDAVAVAFDLPAPTFRHKKYDAYKAGRKGMPPELRSQMPLLKQILAAMGYTIYEREGYEADDILGTLSRLCKEGGAQCVIATGDRDSLQLVGGETTVRLAATKMGKPEVRVYDEERISEEYGVSPKQLIDIKSIQGDSSDNIPGVAGIGEKGALDLVRKFGSLDGVYANLDSPLMKPALRQKLEVSREMALLSRELGTINCYVPLEGEEKIFENSASDKQEFSRLLSKLELFSVIERMGLTRNEPKTPAESTAVKLKTCFDSEAAWQKALQEKAVDLYIEDDGQSVCVAVIDGVYYVIPESYDVFLSRILNEVNIKNRVFDSKQIFKKYEVAGEIEFDAVLAAYLLNPSAADYDLQRLMMEYEIALPGIDPEQEQHAELLKKAAGFKGLLDKLPVLITQNAQMDLLRKIEIPLAKVLADMEKTGFLVDREGIAQFGGQAEGELRQIISKIYELVGYEFNLNSPKQLAEALFERLGLPPRKKTKSGFSTDAAVLEELKYEHPAVELLLEHRKLQKLKSTYVDGMIKCIGEDGRIRSTLNQTETRTGRISSVEPNLQNIPVRTEQGRQLRKYFKAAPGCVLIDADYSQIELRVLADIAGDAAMISAFNSGQDIHRQTAAQIFGVPDELVTDIMRFRAKAVNFGIVYGIGAFSLSKDIGVTVKEASSYIKNYLETYEGVRIYMENVVKKAKEDGYVTTQFARRRYLPELSSANANLRNFGERVARNMPIQGTAADIIKIAMVGVHNALKENGLNAKLIMQVHDELIVEAPVEESEQAAKILKEQMENACKMRVPLIAEVNIGETWYGAKG